MTKWICVFLLACVATLKAEDFQVSRSFNDVSFQFQMPTLPEQQLIEGATYWTSKMGDQTFIVGVKGRSCTDSSQSLRICDVAAFLRSLEGKGIQLQKNYHDQQNNWHWVFISPSGQFLLCSFIGKSEAAFMLMTETDNEADHQRFVESFVFSETPKPKPACCECCRAKGSQCS